MKHIYTLCLAFIAIGFAPAQPLIENESNNRSTEIQRVRINLETPTGYVRQLLLGFTPDNSASDDYDYGYDALNNDNYPDDFGWMIEDDAYIIQGVGSFSRDKFYPIGMFLTNGGNVTLSLHSLENFEGTTNVYIYDTQNNSYSHISQSNLIAYTDAGNYNSRFYITFKNDFPENFWADILTVETPEIDNDIIVTYTKIKKSIKINTSAMAPLTKVSVYDVLGKEIINLHVKRETNLSLSTFKLIKGVYILKLTTTKGILSKKIIIN